MISILIADERKQEREAICRSVRELAGKKTWEQWQYILPEKEEELETLLLNCPLLDMICLDVAAKQGISAAKELRRKNKGAYMTLIADPSMSPALYMRPEILAASLLLRPLSQEQIHQVMEEAVEAFLSQFQDCQEECFVVEGREGRQRVELHRILYFESREKKIYLATDVREMAFYDTLEHLEQQLSKDFLRCHRSYLVNKKNIQGFWPGQNLLLLKGGVQIPVSRSYRQKVKEWDR